MKKQVFYIHGGDAFTRYEDYLTFLETLPLSLPGNSRADLWPKSLAEDLGDEYEVFMPSMPNKYNARFHEWSLWFERHFPYLEDGVVLVGWSLGGMFLAKYLAENDMPVTPGAVFLLAAPCGQCESADGDDCGTFQFGNDTLSALGNKTLPLQIWHSKDDFVVPFSDALAYEEALPQAKTRFFEDKNHFLVTSFPELVEAIMDVR
jgi:predicted alpha/beta hydrolase family esterase